ncbi:hypothetical protein AGMMS50276_03170 [Synergistales bacterium]|nr:hypothetical protein AGMMS50276_03170 [Synergistales bacterium]
MAFFTLDMGADAIADIALKNVRVARGMNLFIESAKGNPFRGYVFSGVKLLSQKGDILFSAEDLSGTLNFTSILHALQILIEGGDFSTLLSSNFPLYKISARNARFDSPLGEVDAKSSVVRFAASEQGGLRLKIDLAYAIGALPLTGGLDIEVPALSMNSGIEINRGDITLGKGELALAGTIKFEKDALFELQGSARAMELSEIYALLSLGLPANAALSDYGGKIDADFSIDSNAGDLTATASVDFKGGRLVGYPVSYLSARVKYAASRLSADNLKTAIFGVPLEGYFSADPKAGDFALRLDSTNAQMSEIAKLYPALGNAGGNIQKLSLFVSMTNGVPSGAIELSSPLISVMNKSIKNAALQVKLGNDGSAGVSGKFIFEGSQAFIQGTVPSFLSSPTLNLTANLKDLDVRKIANIIPNGKNYAPFGKLDAGFVIKGEVDNPTITGLVSAPMLAILDHTFSSPTLSFDLSLNLSASGASVSYPSKGTFTASNGVISASGLNIRYSKVMAPFSIETGKLTVAKGASAIPPDNEALYKSATLTRDGAVTLDNPAKLDFDADIDVSLRLLNILTGKASGDIDMYEALKDASNAAIKQEGNADFRVASVNIAGTKDKPSISVVKIEQDGKPKETKDKVKKMF